MAEMQMLNLRKADRDGFLNCEKESRYKNQESRYKNKEQGTKNKEQGCKNQDPRIIVVRLK